MVNESDVVIMAPNYNHQMQRHCEKCLQVETQSRLKKYPQRESLTREDSGVNVYGMKSPTRN